MQLSFCTYRIPALWVLTIVIFQVTSAKVAFIQDSKGKFTGLTNQLSYIKSYNHNKQGTLTSLLAINYY